MVEELEYCIGKELAENPFWMKLLMAQINGDLSSSPSLSLNLSPYL